MYTQHINSDMRFWALFIELINLGLFAGERYVSSEHQHIQYLPFINILCIKWRIW